MLVSGMQQSDTRVCVCVFFFRLFSIISYEIRNIVPLLFIQVGPCYLTILYIVVPVC